jgi:hypothetical protein
MYVVFFIWLACGVIAGMIGAEKGEGCCAFVLGVLLGPIGIVIALLVKGNRKRCASCKELIHKDASACPKCGSSTTRAPSRPEHLTALNETNLSEGGAKLSHGTPAPPAVKGGERKSCPQCAERIMKEAQVCRFCGYTLPVAPTQAELDEAERQKKFEDGTNLF